MNPQFPINRKNDLVVQEVNGETLIYDLNENRAFALNETSALIWAMCDGNTSLTEMSARLTKRLNAPASEGLVWLGLTNLKKEGLIENEIIPPRGYETITRREAVKRVGLATLIAIPVVASLHAPVAAAAASICMGPRLGGDCHCVEPACPGSTTGAAPATICPGAALSPEGQPGLTNCTTPNSPVCACVGPFVCVNSGPTSMHKQGMCG